MQRDWIYAKAASKTNRLAFRFTAPYLITEVETFTIKLNSITDMIPTHVGTDLTCIFQKSDSKRTRLGQGLFSECSYSAGVYTVKAPIGGLTED